MKNEINRMIAIWRLLARDTYLSEYVTDNDLSQFERRTTAEGITFLTVSLPALGKSLDAAFKTGSLELPEGWNSAKNVAYPSFLRKAWEVIFHPEGHGRWVVPGDARDGIPMLSCEGMGTAALCIRQLTMVFYKYEQPWSKDQANDVISTFQRTEDELWSATQNILSKGRSEPILDATLDFYLDRAEALIGRLLSGVDPNQIEPCYGTGATACKSTPWGRWEKPRFIPKLDEVYPYSEWFFSGLNGLSEAIGRDGLDLLTVHEPTARVVLVPKDSRGPRLISAEPREFMYPQQGIRKVFTDAVESYPNVRAQVSIIDQERNRLLACIGSQTGALATGDLKEASDRVSWWLVTRLFPENWVRALEACRSEYTVLPDGVEIPLTKFAPMGSAVCFPVEALIFWALANAVRKDWSPKRFKEMFRRSKRLQNLGLGMTSWGLTDVSVFGDDIIVPVDHFDRTVTILEAVGLIVNRNKSYATGPFRESCGGDYLSGYDVTPLRVTKLLKGDGINCLFRFKDVCNNISLKYGISDPNLVYGIRRLFTEMFGFSPSIVAVNHKNGSAGFLLLDYYWRSNEPGQTPVFKKDRKTGRKSLSLANTRKRFRVNNPDKPDYNRVAYRVLTEVADEATRDLGWSSVLRSFLTGSQRGGADKYAFRKRVAYELAWLSP